MDGGEGLRQRGNGLEVDSFGTGSRPDDDLSTSSDSPMPLEEGLAVGPAAVVGSPVSGIGAPGPDEDGEGVGGVGGSWGITRGSMAGSPALSGLAIGELSAIGSSQGGGDDEEGAEDGVGSAGVGPAIPPVSPSSSIGVDGRPSGFWLERASVPSLKGRAEGWLERERAQGPPPSNHAPPPSFPPPPFAPTAIGMMTGGPVHPGRATGPSAMTRAHPVVSAPLPHMGPYPIAGSGPPPVSMPVSGPGPMPYGGPYVPMYPYGMMGAPPMPPPPDSHPPRPYPIGFGAYPHHVYPSSFSQFPGGPGSYPVWHPRGPPPRGGRPPPPRGPRSKRRFRREESRRDDTLLDRVGLGDVTEDRMLARRMEAVPTASVIASAPRMLLTLGGCRELLWSVQRMTEPDLQSLWRALDADTSPFTSKLGHAILERIIIQASPALRSEVTRSVAGKVVELARDAFGCRVLQTLLRLSDEEDSLRLLSETKGLVEDLSKHESANHVIQIAIEEVSGAAGVVAEELLGVEGERGRLRALATHVYGCRVVQRLLERCGGRDRDRIAERLLESVEELALHEFGTYVVQHLVERGRASAAAVDRVLACLGEDGAAERWACNKYGSTVLERVLDQLSVGARLDLAHTLWGVGADGSVSLVGRDRTIRICGDAFGNFVVQHLLRSTPAAVSLLQSVLGDAAHALGATTYGRHIVKFLHGAGATAAAVPPGERPDKRLDKRAGRGRGRGGRGRGVSRGVSIRRRSDTGDAVRKKTGADGDRSREFPAL